MTVTALSADRMNATGFSLVANVNKVGTVAFAALMRGTWLALHGIVGIIVTLGGAIMYGYEQQWAKARAPSAVVSLSVAASSSSQQQQLEREKKEDSV